MLEQYARVRGVSPEMRDVARILRKKMTPAEQVLWEAIRRGQLAGLRFRKQHAFETKVFDFYCPCARLILEVDGGVHDQKDVAEHDRLRDEYLLARGFRILRIRNADVFHRLPEVLSRIKEAAAAPARHAEEECGPLPPAPSPIRMGAGESEYIS